jgi:hypothetical protein
MALPALQKTWQGGTTLGGTDLINQTILAANLQKDTLLAIKNALITFNLANWTVVGSSDSVTAAMDATDRWVTNANLVWATTAGTVFSWIVLQQTGIQASFQMLISLEILAAADTNREDVYMGVSFSAGFTGGSTTARPTATDEHAGAILDWIGAEGGTPTDKVLTCIQSDDGECTRVVISNKGNGIPCTSMGFEKPRLPNANFTNPSLWYVMRETVASGLSCFRWEAMQDTEKFWARLVGFDSSSLIASIRMSGPMSNTVELIDAKQATGNVLFWGGGLVYDGLDAEQDLGTLFDWYWCSRNVTGVHALDLDTFPVGGNRTFVCVGDCVWGWLDDSATDLSYT